MSAAHSMTLRLAAASGFHMECTASKLIAEAENGSFCLRPRHRDYATALVPGILEVTSETCSPSFLAVDEGFLVKAGDQVSIATRHAVLGDDLEALERIVTETFAQLDDHERASRAAVARLEADFAHRILALHQHGNIPL